MGSKSSSPRTFSFVGIMTLFAPARNIIRMAIATPTAKRLRSESLRV